MAPFPLLRLRGRSYAGNDGSGLLFPMGGRGTHHRIPPGALHLSDVGTESPTPADGSHSASERASCGDVLQKTGEDGSLQRRAVYGKSHHVSGQEEEKKENDSRGSATYKRLCYRSSERLGNHLIGFFYNKKRTIHEEITSLQDQIQGPDSCLIKETLYDFYKKLQHHLIINKIKKLGRLRKKTGLNVVEGKPNLHNHFNTSSSVVNLSQYEPNSGEINFLSKGLTFCPTKQLDTSQFCSDIEEFFCRLWLKEFFYKHADITSQDNLNYTSKKKKRTNWTPQPGHNQTLDHYIDCFREKIKSDILDKHHKVLHNISMEERKDIQSLKANNNIIIKPTDKGGAVVIMNMSDYIQEAHRQLLDIKYYTPLQEDPTKKYTKELTHIINGFDFTSSSLLELIPISKQVPSTCYLKYIKKVILEGQSFLVLGQYLRLGGEHSETLGETHTQLYPGHHGYSLQIVSPGPTSGRHNTSYHGCRVSLL
ncbi:uncharacterized protein [Phyllobates terribilis]|uniref:uncharacterized protein n=1 Tax=Phyllobates terribilis TaxID=111132 RepID=UPI003CCB1C70